MSSRVFRAFVGSACVFFGTANEQKLDPSVILETLNHYLDVVNPLIAKEIPDPLDLDVSAEHSASTCITKLFKKCVCKASYNYDVSFGTIQGLKQLQIEKFTSVDVDLASFSGNTSLELGHMDLALSDGKAHVHGEACGLHSTADGTAHTKLKFDSRADIQLAVKLDFANQCAELDVSSAKVTFSGVKLHDTHADVKVSLLPKVDVGIFAGLIQKLVPAVDNEIAKVMTKNVGKAVKSAVNKMGCIKIPTLEKRTADVVV